MAPTSPNFHADPADLALWVPPKGVELVMIRDAGPGLVVYLRACCLSLGVSTEPGTPRAALHRGLDQAAARLLELNAAKHAEQSGTAPGDPLGATLERAEAAFLAGVILADSARRKGGMTP